MSRRDEQRPGPSIAVEHRGGGRVRPADAGSGARPQLSRADPQVGLAQRSPTWSYPAAQRHRPNTNA